MRDEADATAPPPPPSAAVRLRLNHGVIELGAETVAVPFPEGAVLRWRTRNRPPPGETKSLGDIEPGAAVSVCLGGVWDEGIVVGRVLRPLASGRFQVDGDVVDYDSHEAAAREHGPLDRAEQVAAAQPDGPVEIAVGDPLGLEELAEALGCDESELARLLVKLDAQEWARATATAISFRRDPTTAPRPRRS